MEEKIILLGFNSQEIIEMERILIDNDKDEALKFLQTIDDKIKKREKSHMKRVII